MVLKFIYLLAVFFCHLKVAHYDQPAVCLMKTNSVLILYLLIIDTSNTVNLFFSFSYHITTSPPAPTSTVPDRGRGPVHLPRGL